MTEFRFEEIVMDMSERPDQAYTKQVENRTEYTEGRSTSFEEEWEALKTTHQVIPSYVPDPINAVRNEGGDLLQYSMEWMDFDSRIEYALEDGFDEDTVLNAYAELEEVISVMHQHPDLVPHGDLIGNTFIVDGSPVLIDPRGIPQDEEEHREWEEEDAWQFQWLKENGLDI